MEFVDTHCHLQFDKLAGNIEQVIKDANDVGVTRLICVGTTVSDSQKATEYADKYKNIWATVGVHPHEAKDFNFQGGTLEMGKMLSGSKKVVAVGEIGLDFYKNYSPKADQEKLFRLQIETSLDSGLPYIFHIRDAQHQDKSGAGQAWAKFFEIIDSYQGVRGVVHSFSASQTELDQSLSRGLYVALNGIMTFTTDKEQLAVAKKVPKDRLLLETDAPFLAPKLYRGQICEPKHIFDIAKFLAELRGEDINELASYTTRNAINLLGLQGRTSQTGKIL
ncbi:TatD family hydrolase [Candidatus Saccharibacteria bacterium]|nr:TatD family hydrolase [Candidatus Saccharibacteria bacterium]